MAHAPDKGIHKSQRRKAQQILFTACWPAISIMLNRVRLYIAIQAARNFRKLRTLGITIRKTIDALVATSCIEKGLSLLYSDRDFDPFVQHLGLRSAN